MEDGDTEEGTYRKRIEGKESEKERRGKARGK